MPLKFLHFAQIFIMAFIGVRLYLSFRNDNSRNKAIKDMAIFFFIFTFYQILLSTIMLTENKSIIIYSYNISMFLFFAMLIFAWKIPFLLFGFDFKKINFLLAFMAVAGFLVVAVHLYDVRMPNLHPSGLIFWNSNLLAKWLTRLSALSVGITWVYIFSKKFLKHLGATYKTKNLFIILGASMLGFSSIFYFSNNYFLNLIAFLSKLIGILFIAALFLFSKKPGYETN